MPSFTYNESGEEIRRLFVPYDDPGRASIPVDDLVVYNPQMQISSLMFKSANATRPAYRDDFSFVIYIDGACRRNGTPDARASFGIYFGPNSRYNTCGLLHSDVSQTSTRAEIEALGAALDIIQSICRRDIKLQKIYIATDSSYLVQSMTEHIHDWIENDGIGSRGKVVAHYERLKELHELLDEMEYGDDGGIEVHFWHIDREANREADALANAALDGQSQAR